MLVAAMPPTLTVLGTMELVEHIISYLNFFDFAGQLAMSSSVTWSTLRIPLQDHAHSITQFRVYIANEGRWEVEAYIMGMDINRAYYWNTDVAGVWHEIDRAPPSPGGRY